MLARTGSALFTATLASGLHPRSVQADVTASMTPPKENAMSHETPTIGGDPYRLPRHVIPVRYDLRLEPDLAAAGFRGQETVTLSVSEPTTSLLLNAADLVIEHASLEGPGTDRMEAVIELEESLERCRLTFPKTVTPGQWRLQLSFLGTLNDKLRGFYRSTYTDASGKVRTLAATQFEATDARRGFPCWDEPDFKAVFSVTLAVDPAMTAVSNGRVESETMEQGKKVVRFADTITMSTYLVAFIVGHIESTAPTFVGKTPVRIWCVPGKQELASFGQDIATASLTFFEEYYGIPYPGDKLDLLAIPDFASGAMENLGAITFRETALLVDRRNGTHGELERVADVVAHENAHMWFGDLVTMSWWNGLWLNEAFATFMEMMAVDAWKPQWKRWDTFCISRAAALSVDGLLSTRPVEYPVRAPKDADAMFDVLTYEKGASVLRMLEQHIGPGVFRSGVRDYLRRHAYGNADTNDLWVALGDAAKHPVPAMMNGWIFQPGYPLVTAELTSETTLTLTQERFAYLPANSPSSSTPAPSWQVPIQLRVRSKGKSQTVKLLMTERNTRLTIAADPESVLVNEGGHGFYRVRYGPMLRGKLLAAGLAGLASTERFNLINDSWATTVAGLTSLADYLELTGGFSEDRDKNVWAILLDSFAFLNRLIEPDQRPAIQAFVRRRVHPALSAVGWTAAPGEDDLIRQLRSELVGAMGRLGNDPVTQTRAAELYEASKRDPAAVDPNLVPALVSILAFTGGDARYDEFADRFRTAKTPQEERRYLFSLTAFRQPDLLRRTLERTLSGQIRLQDAPAIVSAVMGNVYGKELGWEFVKAHWDQMDRQFPKQGLRRMCGGITALATPALEADVRAFFSSRRIDLGGKTLEQYLEQLRITVRFREQHASKLHQLLLAHT